MTRLRAARSTDAGTVGSILTEFAATTPWMPNLHTGAQDIAHAGTIIARGWVTVAVRNRTVIGFAALDGAELHAVYLTKSARGQGVGSLLLDHLKQSAPALKLWTFQANGRAQKFYQRHGFVEVRRTDGSDNDEQLPDIRYHWRKEGP